MSADSARCPKCSENEGEVEISQSRFDHISVSLDLGKAVTLQNPINPTIPAEKMWDPSEYKESCVNPACSEWQDDIEELLRNINEDLEVAARTGDWTHIEKENIEQLAQLSEGALDRVDEQEIEWQDVEKQVSWKRIEDQIDDFEENFEPAAEYTVALHNLRGTPNPGIDKLPGTTSSLENLTGLRNRIEPEVAADVETAPNENDEEQGPVERVEAEIGELKAEKEERIEERKAERETRIEELKEEVEELKEEKQERVGESKAEVDELKEERGDRIEWREEEIEGLSEENEEQIGELQEQVWGIREEYEDRIDERRDQITKTRETYNERIEATRAENNERITEIRDEYDEQITGIRDEYENRIDTRRDRLAELHEQGEDNTIEASTERDAATTEREHDESEAETTTAVANGGADNGAPSSTGSDQPTESEQDGESKQTTSASTSGFDPNRTLSQEEIRELELNSDWSQYNQPRNGSYPTDDPDQTNENDGPTREESSREKNSEKGDEERGGLV